MSTKLEDTKSAGGIKTISTEAGVVTLPDHPGSYEQTPKGFIGEYPLAIPIFQPKLPLTICRPEFELSTQTARTTRFLPVGVGDSGEEKVVSPLFSVKQLPGEAWLKTIEFVGKYYEDTRIPLGASHRYYWNGLVSINSGGRFGVPFYTNTTLYVQDLAILARIIKNWAAFHFAPNVAWQGFIIPWEKYSTTTPFLPGEWIWPTDRSSLCLLPEYLHVNVINKSGQVINKRSILRNYQIYNRYTKEQEYETTPIVPE